MTLPPRSFLPPLTPLAVKPFTPLSVVGPAFSVGLTSAGVGLFVSSIKNSLEPHNRGALGVFTRTGWIIGYFGQSIPLACLEVPSGRPLCCRLAVAGAAKGSDEHPVEQYTDGGQFPLSQPRRGSSFLP